MRPMSRSGWRTVVSGGESHRVTGRSSKPMTTEVAWDEQSPLACRFVDPEGHLVAAREDGRRRVVEVEQLGGATEAALVLEVPVPDQLWVELDAGAVQRVAEAVHPGPAAQEGVGPGDDRDAAVAELEQVLGRRDAAGPVGGTDAGHLGAGSVDRVDDDQRDVLGVQLAPLVSGHRGGHQDHAVGVMAGDGAGPAGRPGITVAYGGDHHTLGPLGGVLLDAAQDLDGPGTVELVEHQVEQPGPAGPTPPRRLVAVLLQQPLDARPGVGSDIGAAVDHLGDRRQGDARRSRDRGERGAWRIAWFD